MEETIAQASEFISPLDQVHREHGASMRTGEGLPGSFGDVQAEYGTVRNGGAGLLDLSNRGRLFVSGSEAVMFLNGLITNDMKTLEPNRWMPAAFPNVQGRLLASVRIVHQDFPDNSAAAGYLIDTEAATHAQVIGTLGRFTLAGDFKVRDLVGETALISLQGAGAAPVIAVVFGEQAAALERSHVWQGTHGDTPITMWRATHTGEDGFDFLMSNDGVRLVWQALVNAGGRPVGADALELLRIEAGLPRFGIDMDETNVVTETGLDDAVSFTKGCYIGQEIIARIKYRGHVAKRLSGLTFLEKVDVARDTKLHTSDGKEIGRITSVTFSPQLGKTIALGYVKYDYLATGTEVLAGEINLPARVSELPFVKGSW
jgi:folate-binding protein YgfZ